MSVWAVYQRVLLLALVLLLVNISLLELRAKERKPTVTVSVKPIEEIIPWNYSQTIPHCGCTRLIAYPLKTRSYLLNSTCSDPGTFYTPAQNVVTFSLHFPNQQTDNLMQGFIEGTSLNLQAMRQYYPNFTMRIYTDHTLKGPQDPFCKALCENPDLFWCDIRKTPLLGNQSEMFFMTWRFLALADPSVDIFLSRDLDSVITARESAVISDWLQLPEKKGIHVMRDKYEHQAAIPGGLWGARNSWLTRAERLQKIIVRQGRKMRKTKGTDQEILSIIYNRRRKDIVAYDSYLCMRYRETMIRPFPTRRQGPDKNGWVSDFVGNPDFGRAKYDFGKCPVECRPRNHTDWEYC